MVVQRQCRITAAVIAGLLVVMGLGLSPREVCFQVVAEWAVSRQYLAGSARRLAAKRSGQRATDGHFCYGDYVDAAPVGGAVSLIGQWQAQLPADAPNHFCSIWRLKRPVLESF